MARKLAPKAVPADLSLLSSDTLARIKAEAKATVQLRKLKAAEEAALAQEIEALEHEDDPVYEKRSVLIDVAPSTDAILIDGTTYHHGRIYEVTAPVYETLLEIIARSWDHENEISGTKRRHHIKPQAALLSAATGQITNRQGMNF